MKSRGWSVFKVIAVGLCGVVLVVICAAAMPLVKNWWHPSDGESGALAPSGESTEARLLNSDTLRLPPETVRALGVETAAVRKATQARPLEMFGQFAPNTDRLFRIRARFPGHVAEIGPVAAQETDAAGKARTVQRQLQVGDPVKKGHVLAVLWSRDLGEKKSELVDGLSQLRLDEELLGQLRQAYNTGSVPLRSVLEQERRVEAGRIATERAERTLRSWEIPDPDIAALKTEAERLRQRGGVRDPDQYKRWARWELVAPFPGTIVEKNANLNEYVDTTSLPLFQLADFSRLTVWAYPYEEDLPLLQALPKPIPWTIRLKADPKAPVMKGTVELILPIIEPNQRTPILKGHVENPSARLLSNQSLTAAIDLPAPPDEVIIPTAALVEDGQESIVFVQPDPTKHEYALRRVAVARRYQDEVYVRSKGTTRAADQKGAPAIPLKPGERVVTSGAVLMKAELEELQSKTTNEN